MIKTFYFDVYSSDSDIFDKIVDKMKWQVLSISLLQGGEIIATKVSIPEKDINVLKQIFNKLFHNLNSYKGE